MHLALVTTLAMSPGQRSQKREIAEQIRRWTPIFVPAAGKLARPSPSPPMKVPINLPRSDSGNVPPPNVQVDLNLISLSFADDVSNQLPDVLRDQNGALALVSRDDPGFSRYIIEPPSWTVEESIVDVSGSFTLSMSPPEKWRLLRDVARAHSIPLDRYKACALFDRSWAACLKGRIQERAGEIAGGRDVQVRRARLAFEATKPCGIDILEVSFAPLQSQ